MPPWTSAGPVSKAFFQRAPRRSFFIGLAICSLIAIALSGCGLFSERTDPSTVGMTETRLETPESHRRAAPGNVICSTCGKEIPVASAITFVYRGHNYYFCSEDCLRRFRENPPRESGE